MKKIIALAALAAISATASASGNLFTDGSFEEVVQSPGTWSIASQATLTADEGKKGWTVSAAPNGTNPVAGLEVRNDVAGTAQDANAKGQGNFVELDGNENDMISQTLKTVAGQAYQVTFWVADRPDVTSDFLSKSGGFGVKVSSGGNILYSGKDKESFGTAWTEETIDFTAVGDKTKFSIWAVGTSDSLGTSFDDFQAVAVPEPASLGLFAAGLAFVGLTARRRRQA
jgi:PEP-CTERM motif